MMLLFVAACLAILLGEPLFFVFLLLILIFGA